MIHIYRETNWLIWTSRNWKLSQSQILNKDANTFLKISFFFRCYSYIFLISNRLPGFWISRLPNVENFFNGNIFFQCKLNTNPSTNVYSFKHICVVCYLKLRFPCFTCLLRWKRVEDVPKTCLRRRLQDVLKTNKCFARLWTCEGISRTCRKYKKKDCRFNYDRFFSARTILAKLLPQSLDLPEKKIKL